MRPAARAMSAVIRKSRITGPRTRNPSEIPDGCLPAGLRKFALVRTAPKRLTEDPVLRSTVRHQYSNENRRLRAPFSLDSYVSARVPAAPRGLGEHHPHPRFRAIFALSRPSFSPPCVQAENDVLEFGHSFLRLSNGFARGLFKTLGRIMDAANAGEP